MTILIFRSPLHSLGEPASDDGANSRGMDGGVRLIEGYPLRYRANAYQWTDRPRDDEIWVKGDLAWICHCSVDSIARAKGLKSYEGPGRQRIYLRRDVIDWLTSRGVPKGDADIRLERIRDEVLGSSSDRGRERSPKRRTP
jgi:hypothetical protein